VVISKTNKFAYVADRFEGISYLNVEDFTQNLNTKAEYIMRYLEYCNALEFSKDERYLYVGLRSSGL
jgi:hypothetical protein